MKSTKRNQKVSMYRMAVAMAIVTLVVMQACVCCNDNGPPPPQKPTEPRATEATEATEEPPAGPVDAGGLEADAQVKREHAKVWTGPGDAAELPELDDAAWHDLEAGSLVTTDDRGEGWVQFRDCMLIYVFRTSKLRKSPCPKSSLSGGNVTCAVEGTSAFNNQCASKIIIQTFTMQLELNGTWLKVSYLPDLQLTVVEVWEGSATVWPVLNAEDYTLGDAVEVDKGRSWFTVPDDVLDEVEGLPVRESLDSLPPQIADFVQPWQEPALARAKGDGVSLTPPPGVQVFLINGGGPMDDPRVREAIQYAVPWAQVAEEAFPDRDAPIAITSMPEGMTQVKPENITVWEVLDARDLDYDPEQARMLLAEAGYPDGFSAAFLFALDDEELVLMAETMASSLGEVGIDLETDPNVIELRYVVTPAEQLVTELVQEGTPVLWLSRQ